MKGWFSSPFGEGAKLDKQTLAALGAYRFLVCPHLCMGVLVCGGWRSITPWGKTGASALLSYGFVSNLSHLTCLIIAWCVHGKKTGLSPLDPGQWVRRSHSFGACVQHDFNIVDVKGSPLASRLPWHARAKPLTHTKPAFLAVYAVFFAFQNVIRPVRFGISVGLTPLFDRLVDFIQASIISCICHDIRAFSLCPCDY